MLDDSGGHLSLSLHKQLKLIMNSDKKLAIHLWVQHRQQVLFNFFFFFSHETGRSFGKA